MGLSGTGTFLMNQGKENTWSDMAATIGPMKHLAISTRELISLGYLYSGYVSSLMKDLTRESSD
jgi:hypothetical protein